MNEQAAVITADLAECEAVIEAGLATFIDVGQALLRIRDDRLYRESHGTFEDYCRERWGFVASRARQLIAAAEVAETVTDVTLPVPSSEGVARELAPLRAEPETLRETWAEAVERNGDKPTAADVREVITERNGKLDVHFSSATDDWATPQDFFDRLATEFPFDLDVCALPSSAKCARYFSPENDGLAQDWTGVCWMNPPYGDAIKRWVGKAHESAAAGATVVCLVPARVDTGWWWDHCRYGEIRFLRGRLTFGNGGMSAPFPSAVVIFGQDYPARVVWWDR